MTTFVYKAKNRTTETVTGQINAQSQEEAIELIHQLGLLPVSVVEKTVGAVVALSRPQKIPSKDLSLFSRQLANLIRSGVPLLRSLEVILEQNQNVYFKSVIENISVGIKNGRSFSNCLADFPRIFSPLYVAMIHAGEEGGNLRDMLNSLANYQQKQQEILSKVRAALAYPVLMGMVGVATVCFILTFVLPKMSGLFDNLGKDLPLPTILMLGLSSFLIKFWWLILVVALGCGAFVRQFLQSSSGRVWFSHFALSFPFLGPLLLRIELARFCRTLELLLKSGLSILRALQISIPVLNNDIIKNVFTQCRNDLAAGGTLGASLKQSKNIPNMLGHLITVGEESGNLNEVLGEIADSYEQETDEQIKVLTSLLEPLMILAVGAVVGFIVFSILLPIFQIDALAQ